MPKDRCTSCKTMAPSPTLPVTNQRQILDLQIIDLCYSAEEVCQSKAKQAQKNCNEEPDFHLQPERPGVCVCSFLLN